MVEYRPVKYIVYHSRGKENGAHEDRPRYRYCTDQRPAAARIVFEDIRRMQNGEPLENEITSSRSKTMTK